MMLQRVSTGFYPAAILQDYTVTSNTGKPLGKASLQKAADGPHRPMHYAFLRQVKYEAPRRFGCVLFHCNFF